MHAIQAYIASLHPGAPVQAGRLTMAALMAEGPFSETAYMLLDEAIAAGQLEVSEVSEAGQAEPDRQRDDPRSSGRGSDPAGILCGAGQVALRSGRLCPERGSAVCQGPAAQGRADGQRAADEGAAPGECKLVAGRC